MGEEAAAKKGGGAAGRNETSSEPSATLAVAKTRGRRNRRGGCVLVCVLQREREKKIQF